jgi:hypothetical protein
MLTKAQLNKLKRIYHKVDHPASYSSPNVLYKFTRENINSKISMQDIEKFLSSQEEYTLFVRRRSNFPRLKIIVKAPRRILSIDLADFQRLSEFNDGFRFALCAVDAFSRYAWWIPLRSKNGTDVSRALDEILSNQSGYTHIHSDRGKEFYNRDVKALLEKYKIILYSTQGKGKAAHSERAIRTIKSRLFKSMHYKNTWRWILLSTRVLTAYNNRNHSAFKNLNLSPKKVHYHTPNLRAVNEVLNEGGRKIRGASARVYKLASYVRLSQSRFIFSKGYHPQNTEEIYQISRIFRPHAGNREPVSYYLKDLSGERLPERFYSQDLIPVAPPTKSSKYKIDVIRKRGRGKNRQHFVHFRGWPAKFDTWISEKDIDRLPRNTRA